MINWNNERKKEVGERLTKDIVLSNFATDIECLALLQELLASTGADVLKIQEELLSDKK